MADIIFIHGAGDSSTVWSRQTHALFAAHRVLAIDLPGHGTRLTESGHDRHELNAEEVRCMMDRAGISKAVVVGHSMGSGVALMLALNHPEQIGRAHV